MSKTTIIQNLITCLILVLFSFKSVFSQETHWLKSTDEFKRHHISGDIFKPVGFVLPTLYHKRLRLNYRYSFNEIVFAQLGYGYFKTRDNLGMSSFETNSRGSYGQLGVGLNYSVNHYVSFGSVLGLSSSFYERKAIFKNSNSFWNDPLLIEETEKAVQVIANLNVYTKLYLVKAPHLWFAVEPNVEIRYLAGLPINKLYPTHIPGFGKFGSGVPLGLGAGFNALLEF